MRNLLTTLLLAAALGAAGQCPPNPSVAHPDTLDVGLQPYQILDYTRITLKPNGDTVLVIPGACFVFRRHLRIPINDTTGVNLAPDSSTMRIPGYYNIEVEGCTMEAYDEKQDFYLVSGLQYPYELRGGRIDRTLKRGAYDYNPLEWDWLKALGRQSDYTMYDSVEQAWVPDTMMWYVYDSTSHAYVGLDPMGCDDPYSDHVVGVTMTYTDRYSSNSFVINGIGDGVFPLDMDIHVPATQYDLPMYPSDFHHNFRKTGLQFAWTDDPTPACCVDPVPQAPSGLKVTQQTRLTWQGSPGATSYVVWRAMAAKAPGGWYVSSSPIAIGETVATSASLPIVPGTYFYSVTAKTCAGQSAPSDPLRR